MEFVKRPEIHDNPFEDPEVARVWIDSVENEQGSFRDKYVYPLIQEWVSKPGMNKVLDLGAGQGNAAKLCEGREYIGLEPSDELVQRAVQLHGPKFVQGSAYDIPLQDKNFDGVFAINVWFHLQDLKRAAIELGRVLNDKGGVLIVNPNSKEYDLWRSWYSNVKEFEGGFEGSVQIPGAILPRNIFYTHSHNEIVKSLEDEGLVLKDSKEFAPLESGRNIFEYYEFGVAR